MANPFARENQPSAGLYEIPGGKSTENKGGNKGSESVHDNVAKLFSQEEGSGIPRVSRTMDYPDKDDALKILKEVGMWEGKDTKVRKYEPIGQAAISQGERRDVRPAVSRGQFIPPEDFKSFSSKEDAETRKLKVPDSNNGNKELRVAS